MQISVIIPTFNRADFILRTIQSIQEQTVEVDEIIVVDDGSTDNTRQVLSDIDIKYIYQDNLGVSSARNTGIKTAQNKWIAFCDSDDIWCKEKLEKQINFHKENPNILISHTDELWKFNNKIIKKKAHQKKPSGYCFKDNLHSCKIGASTLLLNKSILDEVGLFDEKLKACEDYDLWLRILLKYELGLINEELITKTAGHKGQLSFETPMMDTFRIKALEKHINSKYKIEIQKELLYKLDIIIKGASKHNNYAILEKYTKLYNTISLN